MVIAQLLQGQVRVLQRPTGELAVCKHRNGAYEVLRVFHASQRATAMKAAETIRIAIIREEENERI